jgi:hypothetical protein
VTQAGSKIDRSHFYYCGKFENLHSCSLICWLNHGISLKAYVKNGLDKTQNNAVNISGYIVTYADIEG